MRIIVFTAGWCGPCKVYKKLLAKIGTAVTYVDVDVKPDVQEEHNASALPTTIVLSEDKHKNCQAVFTSLGGVELTRVVGAPKTAAEVADMLEDAVMVEGMLKDKEDFAELYLNALREGMDADEALLTCADVMELG